MSRRREEKRGKEIRKNRERENMNALWSLYYFYLL
jgi:hypothetical protein